MSLDADAIVDRRRLRRKLTFWRVAAFVILAAALIAALVSLSDVYGPTKRSAHIARIEIEGVILDDRDQRRMIAGIGKSRAVQGVIVSINSPGGSTTGGEALYEALRDLAGKKPMVAEIRTLGTSAGYMVALAADHVVARHNSITGSIGVLFQFGNIERLLDTLGVAMDAVKSGPLKAEPDFYSQASPDARAMLEALVGESYDWFVRLVAERRGLDETAARRVADGSIVTGFRAKESGLVDELGGEQAAIAWLAREKGLKADLPVITWKAKTETGSVPFASKLFGSIGAGLAEGALDALSGAKGLISPSLTLDGLVSVWHARDAANNSTQRGGGE
ncbi:signal peptide peptidase SppA [Polymorphum gilvum]|uniref:Clp protease:Peptidase U7:Signal peptide peptidase, SppA 36 kDa type n=1 Tax=Polymorphum gilvum (strain LMG 25793 / CGMCC 1.9160 / SL003B-26A1) TaxID=991905 RepID=F2J6X4_POLGS|nr:signal peptide peptidase SppA [Polymorphum gilvum]ADZ72607.1 Clp protease:Peptidase U7:Signal peptide peptidase, SppA 36 kDa type [Polymorphum gilvum SL003B-26A1]